MKIVVVTRCLNELDNIDRFVRCYSFADKIVVSDGGSTDGSIERLKQFSNVDLIHFDKWEAINGYFWNPDNPHINHTINRGLEHNPDWIILDDIDDVPNKLLQENARTLLENHSHSEQINVFRLYMWGLDKYFPQMNNFFDIDYTSLWAWQPQKINIRADETIRHGTIIGLSNNPTKINTPFCLLHYSWSKEKIQKKLDKYNNVDLPMKHPFDFAGQLEELPEWAVN